MQTEEKKPIEFATLYNTTPEDFSFQWDSAPYQVKSGESKPLINFIARHGAKKLADKYAKTSSKEEKEVLIQSFLQNVPVKEMAERLNINLDKIRAEALTKEKEKARVINLESQVADSNKKIEELSKKLEALLVIKDAEKETPKEAKTYKCKQCEFVGASPIEMAQHTKSAHKAE